MAAAGAEVIAWKERCAAAEELTERLLEARAQMMWGYETMLRVEEERPVVDWADKLEEYVALHEQQKDAPNTLRALRTYLTPWVDWLVKEGSRPTDQRIK